MRKGKNNDPNNKSQLKLPTLDSHLTHNNTTADNT